MDYPNNARSALCLTFDFDAESLWLANNPRHADLPGVLSYGRYGARVGVPKILELLAHEELTATFFIPGTVAEQYPHLVDAIAADEHEIAHHGYTHQAPDPVDPTMVERELDMGLAALERVGGIRPVGYRAPDGVSSELGLRLLAERGFLYDSSFKDDYVPYRHRLTDGSPGLIEIPEQPELDDWAFGSVSTSEARSLFPKADVLAIWQDTFRELHDWGGVTTVVMHPQVTGRPMRLATLREFIAYTRTFSGVWTTTCRAVASGFADQERS